MRYSFGSLARPVAVLSIALAGPSAASAQAVMDFTQIACATGQVNGVGSPYTEAGFTLSSTPTAAGFVTWCADSPNYDGPGMLITTTNGRATLTKSDGGPFSIDAIELARHSSGTWPAQSFIFTGNFFGGGTVSQTFVIGAQVGRPTFTPYLFPETWTNLASVGFASQAFPFYQFTNILLDGGTLDGTIIPEPASMALLGTGLVGVFGVGAVRRRRRNESA